MPRVVDMFCGAGLFSYAFASEGFEIADAVELNTHAARTYARNVGEHVRVQDVRHIEPEDDCEVLIAGPPCQGFSTLGKRDPDDPRNQLTMEVARWARLLKPSVVVVENVEAFLLSDAWKELTGALKNSGYRVQHTVLDSSEHGVAQFRRRSFTIAGKKVAISFPESLNNPVTVREAWAGLSPDPTGENNHVAPKPSPIALERMRIIPPGGDKRDVLKAAPELSPPSWLRTRSEATDVWGRMHWDRPSNTLRTCFQNASKGRYIHPEQNRVISLREAARLHSVPDEFWFDGTPTQIARQIGNGVPVALGRAVARSVYQALAA